MMFDILIKSGFVIDGTGAPGSVQDVGIIGDRIEAIGDLAGAEAKQTIFAAGKVVCPGFIDVHVHSELTMLGGIDRFAPLQMGVTTQLASPDGFSWAPMTEAKLKEQAAYLHVFYEDEGIETDGDMSIEKLLSRYRGQLPSNLALQVPHGSIRVEVMGWENREASEDELGRMELMVREWMEAGALAFCTGLEYEPMRRANLHELVRLSKVTAEYGGIYVAHQRGYAEKVEIGCSETFAIAEQANIPVHISHFTVDDAAAAQIDSALTRDIRVTFDMYPYPAGCTHLLMGLPEVLQLGSPQHVMEQIRKKSVREAYADQLQKAFPADRVRFAAVGSAEPTGWEGKSLAQVAEEMNLDLPNAICEILLQTNMQALMIYHWPEERYKFVEQTFKHPLHMISTDGIYVGRRPHPRGYGTYPKVLGEFVRDNKWLSLEQAIYKMSGFPAAAFHIKDRGVLAKEKFADIVIFDPAVVDSPSTFVNPRQEPVGIDCVLVNGHIVIREGAVQPGLHGRVI
ncbi:N-acyl-D-amino-acid deacylase family protein [Paenibacillus eucommiae]|uniref:N-acyl-D-amino-acid deacylase n=1 Tax=Paenibacillus eucommiae TaxID=1355755 RepID=A0ABS4ISW1_9BACL|nr:amidohydrolase family protein [Paenibacillus eucommiae]MBP1990653.1 N-acyl-D-amino-acid deacylase [Paenibacillus eucommiae]